MKIVVLDSDPAFGCGEDGLGSVALEDLHALGDVKLYRATDASVLQERAGDAEVLFTNKVVLDAVTIKSLPQLKLISVLATGVNVVDLNAASNAGVTVCNVPGYSTASTAQHTIALLLELCSQVGAHHEDVSAGGWVSSPSFSYFKAPLVELEGLTLGVVGFGAIGKQVARIASSLGMKILAHTRTPQEDKSVTFVDKESLLRQSDVISLHCPLTEQTSGFIDEEALSKMKESAFVINVSRGPVVDEAALAKALNDGTIRGAATDVLSQEPPQADNPLLAAKNCIITSHVAWASQAARQRLLQVSIANVQAFEGGAPQNVVAAPK